MEYGSLHTAAGGMTTDPIQLKIIGESPVSQFSQLKSQIVTI